jgi:hypothetical protein
MSKTDDLRALREARYEQRSRQSKPVIAPTDRPPTKAPQVSTVSTDAAVAGVAGVAGVDREPEPALCGHRAISGRTCTREHGHAAKSHRYS